MSRYLNEEGLQVVADNVKEAKEVAAGALALAQEVSETSTIAFTGTFAEWNALSAAEKARFANHIVNITDDSSDTVNAVRNPDWNRVVDLKTYTFSTTPYTVPEDGIFVVCRLRPITPDVISTMSVNNKSFISVKGGGTTTAETNSNTCIPVAQGDVISIDNPREQDQIWFVPYKTEIVVTEPMNYSTTEQDTGKFWIDGKKIYRKVVDCGGLPNTDTKNIAHNISDIDTFLHIEGVANQNNKTSIPINYINPTAIENSIGLYVNDTDVTIITTTNLTNYVKVYVFLEYTKTTN